MKKIFMLAIVSIALFSCKKDDNDTFVTEISHSVKVTYGEAYNNTPAPNAKVVFHNKISGVSKQVTTGSNGETTLTLPAGMYRVSVEKNVAETEMEALSGIATETVFTAAIENVIISSKQNVTTELKMKTSRVGGLVIKQIYYAGSDTKRGAIFRDQFFEIHNNSNEDIPLAGLCYGRVYGLKPDKKATSGIKNDRYDWSQSLGLEDQGESANTDYVYVQEILRIPATAQPLKAGESVIIAATALNHKNPLVITENGKERTYAVEDSDLTIDLSNAPYEAYYADYFKSIGNEKSALPYDIDNPNSVNMDIIYKTNGERDLVLNPQGRMAMVIFYLNDEAEKNQWRKALLPTADPNGKAQVLHLQVPIGKIIDGVNFIADKVEDQYLPLPETLDASGVKTTKGAYSSQSVIRKHKVVNGRKVYQDTNNSINDFEVLDRPDTSSLN